MKLTIAKALAEDVVKTLSPFCSRIEIAGSIRREKEDVKDIEIVAIVDDYQGLFKAMRIHGVFIKPGVPDIQEWEPKENAKYLRVLLDGGIKLDLFIATMDNWGPLFCMRTGSGIGPNGSPFSGFIPAMFKRWKKVSGGGKMVGCMPTMPDGLQLICQEEKDYFELLGVKWVEPKDRIDNKAVVPLITEEKKQKSKKVKKNS